MKNLAVMTISSCSTAYDMMSTLAQLRADHDRGPFAQVPNRCRAALTFPSIRHIYADGEWLHEAKEVIAGSSDCQVRALVYPPAGESRRMMVNPHAWQHRPCTGRD